MIEHDIAETLDDIFNVPKNGSNLVASESKEDSQEDAYAEATTGKVTSSFEEKAAGITEKLGGTSSDVEFSDHDNDTSVISDSETFSDGSESNELSQGSPETILSKAIPIKTNKIQASNEVDFEQADKADDSKPKSIEKTDIDVRPEPKCDTEKQEEIDVEPPAASESSDIPEEGSDGWLLESPVHKFEEFYAVKRSILPTLLVGGKVNLDHYRKELNDAQVDTSNIDMLAHNDISNRMGKIRMWRDRVLQIREHVTVQYYKFQWATPMLEGSLARCIYEKPIIRQQGLNLIHLRDFEDYLSTLKYLYDYTADRLRNLDGSHDSLSRLITMSMPQKALDSKFEADIDSSEIPPQIEKKPAKIKSDLSGYDSLDNAVKQEDFTPEKTKEVISETKDKKNLSWDDID